MRLFAAAIAVTLPAMAAQPVGPTSEQARAEARELLAYSVGLETSIGKGQVPLLAQALADRFKKAGFAEADIHIIPYKETASLVVR